MTAMLVETFEVTEVDADGQFECEAEALALIEKLGLEGQQKLIAKNEAGEATRCPYRKMTAEEHRVYKAICPQVKKLNEYSDSPIPVRVLQVAAHAVDLFQEVQVWSADSADIKDPVLVGHNKVGYTYEYFILARWGEVLEPLDKLKTLAARVVRAKRSAALSNIVGEAKSKLEALEHASDDAVLNLSEAPSMSDYNRRSI